MTELTEMLGHTSDERVVIVSCDGLGTTHAANAAIFDVVSRQRGFSASLIVPGPWARAASASYRGEDVGVELTLNSELDLLRWGPITHAPSLLDGDGAFPRTVEDVWEHADVDEVHREWQAQIERAVLWGFGITHLATHMTGVELRPEFFDVYLDLAEEFRLPVRLPGSASEGRVGFPFRSVARGRGVVAPDHVIELSALGDDASAIAASLTELPPGVTDIHVAPAIDSEELRAATPDWESRVEDYRRLLALEGIVEGGNATGVTFAAYRELTALTRGESLPIH
jgi:predicted glycoside hydrolase/deacetylase ChbG (UPF0249 family)